MKHLRNALQDNSECSPKTSNLCFVFLLEDKIFVTCSSIIQYMVKCPILHLTGMNSTDNNAVVIIWNNTFINVSPLKFMKHSWEVLLSYDSSYCTSKMRHLCLQLVPWFSGTVTFRLWYIQGLQFLQESVIY